MSKAFPALFSALTILAASGALAQTVPFSDRPLVVDEGTGEAKIDMFVGLNSGFEGGYFGFASGLASDRASGIHIRAGIVKNFELGLGLQFLYSMDKGALTRPGMRPDGTVGPNPDGSISPPVGNAGPEGDGTMRLAGWGYNFRHDANSHLNPLYIYGRYAFLPQLGLEFGLIVPTEQVGGLNRPALRFGIPFKYVLSPGLLSVHVRPDLVIGFAAPGTSIESATQDVYLSFYVDAGLTLNLVDFFLDITVAYGGDVYPYKKGYLPLSILMGYTVLPRLDVYAGFTMANLIPETGSAADARNLTVGFKVRF